MSHPELYAYILAIIDDYVPTGTNPPGVSDAKKTIVHGVHMTMDKLKEIIEEQLNKQKSEPKPEPKPKPKPKPEPKPKPKPEPKPEPKPKAESDQY